MLDFSASNAKALAAEALLKDLAHAGRLMLLCEMVQGERSVGYLVEKTGFSQSSVSQHLARLKQAGIVESRKQGQFVYYRLANMDVQAILSTLYLIFCRNE